MSTIPLTHVCAPKRLNGYPVERYEQHPNCFTVQVRKPDREIVIATWWPELKTTWMWGHYIHWGSDEQNAARAEQIWSEVTARNEGR